MGRTRRIPLDPNNHRWVKDTTTFGQRALRSQGWTPGSYLGKTDALHAAFHTAASASHVRVLLEEDQGGIGWRKGGGRDAEDARIAGLDAVQDIFARLNGKVETEAERAARERRKAMEYVGQTVGGMTFVRGGLLVQDDLEVTVEEGMRTPIETEEAIEKYEAREDAKELEEELKVVAAGKKRKAEESDADRAERKRRRKEEKAEKQKRREGRRKRKEASGSTGTETEGTATEGTNLISQSASQAPSTTDETTDESMPRKRAKKSKLDVADSNPTDSSTSTKKKSKKDRKSKSKPSPAEQEVVPLVDPEDTEQAAAPRTKKSKKDKKSKRSKSDKEASSSQDEPTRSSTASQIPTPDDTSSAAPSRTATPLMGRHIHHARRVAAKQAALMDATALKGILAI